MNEIKLRVWDDIEEKIINWKQLKIEKDESEETLSVVVFDGCVGDHYDHFPMMRFTGLKDKSGKEIYEGDILKRTVTVVVYESGSPPEDIEEYLLVEYRDDYAGFYVGERPLFAYVDTNHDVDTGCKCTKAEVVGNRYENPELLIC